MSQKVQQKSPLCLVPFKTLPPDRRRYARICQIADLMEESTLSEEHPLSRREFGKAIVAIIAGVSSLVIFKGGEKRSFDPSGLFVSLRKDYTNPQDVAAAFVKAKSPLLMASYAVFFPDFLRRYGRSAVDKIRKASNLEKQKYSKDHHRLDALPAVTACHFLPFTKEDKARHTLTQEIAAALADPRREVREIVIQNLITATAPDIDVFRFFSVDSTVLSALKEIILQAEENPKLLMPVSLCAEFLLNAEALLKKRTGEYISPYSNLLDRIRNSKSAHFWYVARLIDVHRKTFTVDAYDHSSLPPQSSEALMGWKNLYQSREYLEQLALIRAHLIYVNLQTASGAIGADEVMNTVEAQRALPKTIAFFRNFDLVPLQNFDLVAATPKSDEGFRQFMSGEFRDLIEYPSKFGVDLSDIQPSDEEIRLAECVPFAQYSDYSLLTRLVRERDDNKTQMFWKNTGAFINSLVVSWAAFQNYDKFVGFMKRVYGFFPDPESQPSIEKLEEAAAYANEKENQIDTGKYVGIDEQQRELGPIPLPNGSGADKHDENAS